MSRGTSRVVEPRNGIRPEKRFSNINDGFLTSLKGLRPSSTGLQEFEPIGIVPSKQPFKLDWPFPQVFKGEKQTLLVFRREIIDITSGRWVPVHTYSAEDPSTFEDVRFGETWSFTSIQDMWFLTNGASLVFFLPSNPDNKALVTHSPTIEAVGSHDDRVLFGGLAGTRFTQEDWLEFFNAWQVKLSEDNTVVFDSQSFDTNWLLWALPGGLEDPFLSLPVILGISDIGKAKSALLEQINRGVVGMLPLPSSGKVLYIKPFGGNIVVYTEDAAYLLNYAPSQVPDMAGRYLQTQIADQGIFSKATISGDDKEHVFVGSGGDIWNLTPSTIQRMGYRDLVLELDSSSLRTSFDTLEREFYISDGSRGFVLGPQGLSETAKLPTSLYRGNNQTLVGPTKGENTEFELTMGIEDFADAGIKNLSVVEVIHRGLQDLKVTVDFKYDALDSFRHKPFVLGSPERKFFINVQAREFRTKLQATLGDDPFLERIVEQVIFVDSRSVRGPRPSNLSTVQPT